MKKTTNDKKISYTSFNSFVYSVLNYNDINNNSTSDQPMKRYFLYYIFLYVWMIRMSMSVIGLFGPLGYSIYRKINPKDIEPIIHGINTIKWVDYLTNVSTYSNLDVPYIVDGVPILSSANVLYLLKERDNTNIIYASNQTMFTSFNDNSIWANLYNITPSFINIDRNDNNSNGLCRYSYDEYLEPIDDPLFQAVAPSLVKVMTAVTSSYKNHKITSNADIHMSHCRNITFTPRYSYENTLILQLIGAISVMIVAPDNYDVMYTHSRFHPEYQHSHNKHLTNVTSFHSYPQNTDAKRNNNGTKYVKEITMTDGTMVFIPSHFYYSIQDISSSSPSSPSSTWISMRQSTKISYLSNKLFETVILEPPYFDKDKHGIKLSSVAFIIKYALVNWDQNIRSFIKDMIKRYQNIGSSSSDGDDDNNNTNNSCSVDSCTSTNDGVCTSYDIGFGNTSIKAKRGLALIESYLTDKGISPSIKRLILMDLTEIMINDIYTNYNNDKGKKVVTTCVMLNFLNTCFFDDRK